MLQKVCIEHEVVPFGLTKDPYTLLGGLEAPIVVILQSMRKEKKVTRQGKFKTVVS